MSRNNNAEFVIPEMRSIRNIHMIGIAGSGMSGIAEVLFNLGYLVTGSDIAASAVTERLEKIGIKVFSKHHPGNIGNADVVVCGHIHRPEIKELNGVLYCNDGDWIESCTALVEDETGDLSILNWGEERERLKLIYFEEQKKLKENAA